MKKWFILLLALISLQNVYADVETYERTNDNLRVHESIEINGYNTSDILNTPSVSEKEKVYDFANLLTDIEEANLYDKIVKFINDYNMDLVLVTINENWTTAEKYADNFYDYNYFGINNTFDGVLLLIDMDNREIYISTNGEAILMYNDYRIEKILDDMYYYLQNNYYFDTFSNGIDKLESYAQKGIPDENKNSYIDSNGDYIYVAVKTFPFLAFLGISVVVATIVLIIFIYKNKLVKKAYDAKEYIEEESAKITSVSDRRISSNTSKIRISSDTSSSGSSRGSSSTHRSSSGRSHGGGGRRF